MRRFTKYISGLILGTLLMGSTAFAAPGYTVTDAPAVLYTNDATVILADADTKAQVILSADAIASGLPIQVTGVTSNGFFRISLNNATYYVAGAGLQAAPAAQATAPAQNTGKKYTCVIEAGDEEKYYKGMRLKMWWGRQDCTDRPSYTIIRDVIEQNIASGLKYFTYEYKTSETKAVALGDNILVDVKKAHPEFNTNSSRVRYNYYANAYNSFGDNGDREVVIEFEFSITNDETVVEDAIPFEDFVKWVNEHRGQ